VSPTLRRRTLLLLAATLLIGTAQAMPALHPPPGYLAAVVPGKPGASVCAPAPPPYTQSLQFRSKYEGSDSARATLSPEADAAFKLATQDITEMERHTANGVMRYLHDGRPEELTCTLDSLAAWANAGALLSKDFNHTGKSMRKWALATLASSYLALKFSSSQPLAGHPEQARQIEAWLGRVADQVVSDWSDLPLQKINNHSYWAAWSVMASAVVLDRRDLFDWSLQEYRIGAGQVDALGMLPNELKRKQRALAYHNYAIGPLAMIASFALANGIDVRDENHAALQRLGQQILSSASNPTALEQKSAARQDMSELQNPKKWVWLAPWCSLYACSADALRHKHDGQPARDFRLGGDLSRLYGP